MELNVKYAAYLSFRAARATIANIVQQSLKGLKSLEASIDSLGLGAEERRMLDEFLSKARSAYGEDFARHAVRKMFEKELAEEKKLKREIKRKAKMRIPRKKK